MPAVPCDSAQPFGITVLIRGYTSTGQRSMKAPSVGRGSGHLPWPVDNPGRDASRSAALTPAGLESAIQCGAAAGGRRTRTWRHGLTPGRALNAGCGEGADAIWLAGHGWQVTAVDISAVALARGAAQRAARPAAPQLFFTAADIAASLDPHEWAIVVSAARERSATDPDGRTITVHDTVLRASGACR